VSSLLCLDQSIFTRNLIFDVSLHLAASDAPVAFPENVSRSRDKCERDYPFQQINQQWTNLGTSMAIFFSNLVPSAVLHAMAIVVQ